MAKKTATPASAATTAPTTTTTTTTPTPAKKAPGPKRQPKAAVTPASDNADGPKKRIMTAVPSSFVSAVESSLSPELVEKLKTKGVKEVCEAFIKTLVNEVKCGKTVSFTNNFTFARRVRTARNYKNLKTGDPINKPAHYVMTMSVKPALKKDFDTIVCDTATGGAPVSTPVTASA